MHLLRGQNPFSVFVRMADLRPVTQIVLTPRSVLPESALPQAIARRRRKKDAIKTARLLSRLQELNANTFSLMSMIVCVDPLDPLDPPLE